MTEKKRTVQDVFDDEREANRNRLQEDRGRIRND